MSTDASEPRFRRPSIHPSSYRLILTRLRLVRQRNNACWGYLSIYADARLGHLSHVQHRSNKRGHSGHTLQTAPMCNAVREGHPSERDCFPVAPLRIPTRMLHTNNVHSYSRAVTESTPQSVQVAYNGLVWSSVIGGGGTCLSLVTDLGASSAMFWVARC